MPTSSDIIAVWVNGPASVMAYGLTALSYIERYRVIPIHIGTKFPSWWEHVSHRLPLKDGQLIPGNFGDMRLAMLKSWPIVGEIMGFGTEENERYIPFLKSSPGLDCPLITIGRHTVWARDTLPMFGIQAFRVPL